MNFADLREHVQGLGLDVGRLVSRHTTESRVSGEVGYNIIVGSHGAKILASTGRGGLVPAPYAGFTFPDEEEACSFVWRMIRSQVAPELLTPSEKELIRAEAIETLKH
ncbi:hypothetical protein [Frondihabitans australicus]|uniref:Uncharacterized protein n=1 Tax=Frondihabitans australicus TaxID=386892 RepID=A0A495IG93_9MICO|nr:hypothetical protein [Frondihabitans australicus]RKR74680.1 hypothetical protein C8E83_1807 [Frondihabitans australicus]